MNQQAIREKVIEGFGEVARKNRWKIFYDREDDCLYWTKIPLPKNSKLTQLSKEVSFYTDNKGNPTGVMVQFFENNFLAHNKDIAIINKFMKKKDGDKVIEPGKNKELETFLIGFAESIKKDIYKEAAEENYSLKDLGKFLANAVG